MAHACAVRAVRAAHNHIGQAVGVDIACRRDTEATVITRCSARDHEAAHTRGLPHRREVDLVRVGLAKHHIAAAIERRTVARTHDHVGIAVAVDVARCRNREAGPIAARLRVDDKTTGTHSRGHIAQVDFGGARLAIDHVSMARRLLVLTNEQVGIAIAVDVAGR